MSDMERLAQFEKMKIFIEEQHSSVTSKMEAMKADGKNKTVSYKQLMANKLSLENMLQMYKLFDIE